jgi:uncharacterized protein YbcI
MHATGDELTRVCGEVAAVFARTWGRGPEKTTAHWAGPNMLVVLLENGHTVAEKTMRAAGHIQELVGGRQLLQLIVEDELIGKVEAATGRQVITTLSATRLDPDMSAEIFIFGDAGEDLGKAPEVIAEAEAAQARARELADDSRALGAQYQQLTQRWNRLPEQDE